MVGVTGIAERRWAADGEKPSQMAYKAAVEAIEKSGLEPSALDAIVVTTTTPDVAMPSTACILQEMLGVRGIPAFDLNAACSGWLYGLAVAKGLLLAGQGANILVVGVEVQSQLLEKTDRGTYFLFGDGAGAAVVAKSGQGHRLCEQVLVADSKGLHMARRHAPGYMVEPGGDPWVRLDGHALFRFATESFSSLIRQVIEKSGWGPGEVRWVVPHQANGRILKAAASRSGVAFERFYLNIGHVGNTSSASIPLALLEIERGIQKGDKIVLCSVGAGITAAAVAIEW
jgi:3-oxoacyl-[acyl-carrier-protein] synthase-3